MRHYVIAATGLLIAAGPAPQALAQGIEEIVVTVRKREESLASVPLSVSAFTEGDFVKRGMENLGDVARFTPGFSFENYTGGITPSPVIRGLSQTALQSRIQNVGFFIDGVYIQQQGNIDFGLLGIERLEVVKGPQSALYGRNSFAGAINYVTKKPTDEFEGQVGLTLGTDSREDRRITVSGPIVPGLLTGRITTGTTEFDGTWKNHFRAENTATGQVYTDKAVSFRGGRGTDGNLGGYDNKADVLQLRLTPREDLTFDLAAYRFRIRNDEGAAGTLEQTTNASAIGQLNCNPRPPSNSNFKFCGELDYNTDELIRDPRNIGNYADSRIWSLTGAWQINDALAAKYQYAKTNLDAYSYGVGSGATVIQSPGTNSLSEAPVTSLDSDSHELRFEYDAGRWSLMAGGYYMEIKDSNQQTAYNVQMLASGTNIVPTGGGPFAPFGVFVISNDRFEDEMLSGFGAFEFQITDTLTLGTEARWTREKKKIMDLRSPANNRGDTFNYFTPRVSLDWQFRDDALLYGSVAQGVKSGGFNSATADPGFENYDEEKNTTYEIGSKLRLLGGNLQLNTAVYYIDWDDLQIAFADVVPAVEGSTALEPSYIGNAKGAESIGIELDGAFSLTDNLLLTFAASLTESKFARGVLEASLGSTCNPDLCRIVELPVEGSETINRAADIGRNRLSRTPKTQLAAGIEYSSVLPFAGLSYTARTDVSYQSKMFAENLNLATIEDRTLVNATLQVGDDDRWSVNFWMKNVFDKEYISNAFVTNSPRRYIAAFGDGRTAGVTATLNF